MNRVYFLSITILFQYFSIHAQKLADPILLWPAGAPGATGNTDEDKPAIIPFIAEKSISIGAAVLVIPGGGFTIRAVDHEGVLVAQWFKSKGITAFLLRYRLRPLYERKDWLLDGQRAVQYIRAHAGKFNISANRIGAVGFSAGANLVADLGFNPSEPNANSIDGLDHFSTLPDFNILAYGAMTFPQNMTTEKIKSIPPTFMYGTVEDAGSVQGMTALYTDMVKHKVPVEAHFFRNGVHGTGFAIGDPILGEWTHLLYNWMKAGGWLTNKEKVELNGRVKLDGQPLLRGILVFTSLENKNYPQAVVYITNTGTGELGRFKMLKEQGLVPGKYKVEIRQEATRWTSNSRDPFMIDMMAKQRDNTLTEEDKKSWGEFLRNRNLSPSINNQKVYKRQRPESKTDYQVVIKEGLDLNLEVFSK